MQIIENYAWLTCLLHTTLVAGDAAELSVAVEQTAPFESYPNLLAQMEGSVIILHVKGPLPGLAPGMRFRIKAAQSGPGVYWAAADTLVLLPQP